MVTPAGTTFAPFGSASVLRSGICTVQVVIEESNRSPANCRGGKTPNVDCRERTKLRTLRRFWLAEGYPSYANLKFFGLLKILPRVFAIKCEV